MHWVLYSIDTHTAVTTIWQSTFQGRTKTQQTRHPGDVQNLVAALYVGTYLDTDRGSILRTCMQVSRMRNNNNNNNNNNATPHDDAGCGDHARRSGNKGCCCCTEGRCTKWAMSVLNTMHESGILALPTSTTAIAEFSVQMATKYDSYGQTPKTCHWLDWMGEALLDLSWVPECVAQEWLGQAFLDLSFLPDVQEWAAEEENLDYLADHGRLPDLYGDF